LRDGYEVRILDDLDPRVHPHGRPKHVPREAEFIQGSVIDRSTWERALEGVDVVSHQAAYQDYMLDFSRFLMVNAVSTALMYEVLVDRWWRPRKVIVASSQAVYGEGQYTCLKDGLFLARSRLREQLQRADWEVHCPECGSSCPPGLLRESHPNPQNQYAVSKLSGENMALGLGTIHQIPTVALRYSITQGPRQSLFNQYSVILRIFTARAVAREPVIIYEDGLQTRDFVHVADVVDANFCVLDNDNANFNAFNVGSGRPTTVLEYADLLIRTVGKGVARSIPGQYRVGDNRHSVSNVAKLIQLGWKPERGLEQILQDFLAWVDATGGIPASIPDAYREMRDRGVVQGAA
jgi:dTDP-L-rhamnose 4-epimerase